MKSLMIGFAGSAFNQDKEQEMAFGDKMAIGGYTLAAHFRVAWKTSRTNRHSARTSIFELQFAPTPILP